MRLNINKLYQLIFADGADLEKNIGKINSEVLEKSKESIIKKRKKEIIDFFSQTNLRHVIRAANNHHLEMLLFDNIKDNVNPYLIPDEKTIDDNLQKLETEFKLLANDNRVISNDIRLMFHAYFKIAKLIADEFEKNNDQQNSVAFQHAYKMLVLFGNDSKNYFGSLEKYLEHFNYYNESAAPLHDALIYQLPKIQDNKIHLEDWRKLLRKEGPKLLELFNMAPAIEKQLGGKCPSSLKEAMEAKQDISYKRAKENPVLASQFIKFNLDEKLFDQAIEIDKKRKKQDFLPNVRISGADLRPEYRGYHLVKLPIEDPNAYVLGHLTNCCQSIGGHSEKCVIDGITRENNGFYVLLKEKKKFNKLPSPNDEKKSDSEFTHKTSSRSPLIMMDNGKYQIDYSKCDIVGQGYAWLSMQGNLVFDSWENKSPDREDKIIAPLLEKFSQQVVADRNLNMLRVSIGSGGKTPKLLKSNISSYAEDMKEGTQYQDSRSQSTIYVDEERRNLLIKELELIFKNFVTDFELTQGRTLPWKDEFLKKILDSCYSEEHLKQTKLMLTSHNIQKLLSTMKEDIYLVYHAWPVTMNSLNILRKIELTGCEIDTILGKFLFIEVPAHKISEENILNAITKLKQYGLHNNHDVRKYVFTRYSNPEEKAAEYEEAALLLNEAKIKDDNIIRNFVFNACNVVGCAEYAAKAYALLRQANIHNDQDVLYALFGGEPWYGGFECLVTDAKKMIKALSILTAANLDNDKDVRSTVLRATDPEVTAKNITDSYSMLKQANLIDNANLKQEAFKYDANPVKTQILISEFLQTESKLANIHSVLDNLQQTIEALPNNTNRLFTSLQSSQKIFFLDTLTTCRKNLVNLTQEKAESELLLTLIKLYGNLAADNNERFIKEFKQILNQFHITIPDELRILSDGEINNEKLFADTLDDLRKQLIATENKLARDVRQLPKS